MNRIITALFIAFLAYGCTEPTFEKPNVILIITDDQGYGDIGAHGNKWIKTPQLDKLYEESVRLTDFHVGTTCAPTRGGLMTGMNCNRARVWHTIAGRSLLDDKLTTLPEILKANGYATAMYGKWHLGDNYPFRPEDRGFEEVLIHKAGGVGQSPDYWLNDYFDDTYFHNGKPKKFAGYCTDIWFENAMQFIEAKKDQPFFCYVATNAPHSPFHVAEKYTQLYADNDEVPNPNFYGMITNIDDNLGKLEQQLEELGIKDNTILIFMTDNGTSAGVDADREGFKNGKGFNAGMRGKKGSKYDGGHRVPFFIRWANGKLATGQDVAYLTVYSDIFPTILELCRIPATNDKLDGESLVSLLKEPNAEWKKRTIITDTQRQESLEKWRNPAVMTDQWRLNGQSELYDIEKDPGQTTNVAEQFPDVVKELTSAYETWWADVSEGAETFMRIEIGNASHEKVTELSCHDAHITGEGYVAWNQNMVRSGKSTSGFWALKVAEAGKYKIALRRWPIEAQTAMNDTIPMGEAVPGGQPYPVGKNLGITKAGIKMGDDVQEVEVKGDELEIVFEVELAQGAIDLTSWFITSEGEEIVPFYAYVEKL